MMKSVRGKKAWVVAADMGYGHQRAVYPLKDIAENGIICVGKNDAASPAERKLWERVLWVYEFLSRAKSIPIIGSPLFTILDSFLRIPSPYPMRNLSNSTFQVNLLASSIKKGLCAGMLEKIKTKHLPLITSFYAPAIAADMNGQDRIYCIICDADLNRAWVAKEPSESRIDYVVPCGKAAQRLRAYGVPDERIFVTGFPLSAELLGGNELAMLKSDLGQRLYYLDPKNKFSTLHGMSVEHFLGKQNYVPRKDRVLTITYSVGGAGAQKEIGGQIARSLKKKLLNGDMKLNLVAGTKEMVRDYFLSVKSEISSDCPNINVVYASTLDVYFQKFNALMHETDILWTKPSELSFYCALGIPVIMAPAIGSQEKFNRRWLLDIQAGIEQEHARHIDQWLFELLNDGRLAEAAWSGFLKARKLGTYKILEILEHGTMTREQSPLMR
jgi:hypothetical protein